MSAEVRALVERLAGDENDDEGADDSVNAHVEQRRMQLAHELLSIGVPRDRLSMLLE